MNGTMQADGRPLVSLASVTKTFGGTVAVQDVSMEVHPGQVHCLLGDNGAGKSTIINIISGVLKPTSGQMLMDGQPVSFAGPRDAFVRGIATVHQNMQGVPLMSVARNFFLGAEPRRKAGPFRFIDLHTAGHIAVEELGKMGIRGVEDGRQLVGTLSGGERQALAISRAAYFGARLLILDEPTSALGVKEAEIVLRLILAAKQRGIGVVFITHNAHHAMAVGDRFTVLIHGLVADSFSRGERSREEVLSLMAGGEALEELAMEVERASGSSGAAAVPAAAAAASHPASPASDSWPGHAGTNGKNQDQLSDKGERDAP
jgi:simple sugar transport system ATP-binding protein